MTSKKRRTLAASIALYSLLTSGCTVKDKLDQNVTLKAIKSTIEEIIQNTDEFFNKNNAEQSLPVEVSPIPTTTPTVVPTPTPTENPYVVSQSIVDNYAYSCENMPIFDENGNEIAILMKNQMFYIYTTNYNYDFIVIEDGTCGYKASGHIINNVISESHEETDDYFFITCEAVSVFDENGNEIGQIEQYQKVHRLSTNGIYDYVVTREGYEGYIPCGCTYKLDSDYVEIDISDQILDLFVNNENIVNTKIVTGKPSSPTYEGCFSIYGKSTDEILTDDETYWSYVQYWMPFNEGIGLHDANWRSQAEFDDSTTYLWGGSHGCVNIPPYITSQIYDNVDVGTMVLVHK